jgi:mono/diheme cytochrome c family protein
LARALGWAAIGVIGIVLVLQGVPYGRSHTNPPGRVEPRWDAPQTRALAVRACFDCHSNETVWPWYSHVAPISWLIQRDVDEGRRKLNFSAWDRPQKEAHESAKTVRKGEMPLWFYPLIQRDARLTAVERQALIAGLEATLGAKRAGRGGENRRGD